MQDDKTKHQQTADNPSGEEQQTPAPAQPQEEFTDEEAALEQERKDAMTERD